MVSLITRSLRVPNRSLKNVFASPRLQLELEGSRFRAPPPPPPPLGARAGLGTQTLYETPGGSKLRKHGD